MKDFLTTRRRSFRCSKWSILLIAISGIALLSRHLYVSYRYIYDEWLIMPAWYHANWPQHLYNQAGLPPFEALEGHLFQKVNPPTPIPELSNSEWHFPQSEPKYVLAIHIFTSVNNAARRAFLREHSPLHLIASKDRPSVTYKFVVGRSEDPAVEAKLDEEEATYNDLIRLNGLVWGENMDQGKSLEWIRTVGKEEIPIAKWVIKCDDDTMPLLYNLVPYLKSNDWRKPSYFGTTLRKDHRLVPYMAGLMYGFSWSVLQTIAAAPLRPETLQRHFYEDAYVGELMALLPPAPRKSAPAKEVWTNLAPSYKDPRTGLVWLDVGRLICDWDLWWCATPDKALGWHNLKTDDLYRMAWDKVKHWD